MAIFNPPLEAAFSAGSINADGSTAHTRNQSIHRKLLKRLKAVPHSLETCILVGGFRIASFGAKDLGARTAPVVGYTVDGKFVTTRPSFREKVVHGLRSVVKMLSPPKSRHMKKTKEREIWDGTGERISKLLVSTSAVDPLTDEGYETDIEVNGHMGDDVVAKIRRPGSVRLAEILADEELAAFFCDRRI